MSAQLIPVRTWAAQIFGEFSPHPNTLLNWIHNGRITPVPIKVGSRYFCQPTARYVDPHAEEIERMVNGRR
ncbi:excisionase [Paraburkholderia unamae]|uniref:Excisionase-like protein n=1 Tax=Paraburkholderia unamae TaxID=219649 RepID=A0ABX5K6X6_9BURK|nr:excisionase [Paraburkholderia unamae]PVX61293.1 excisionase-like protein [Paraburkholderia unamae]